MFKRFSVFLYGIACYGVFLVTNAYAIGFVGNVCMCRERFRRSVAIVRRRPQIDSWPLDLRPVARSPPSMFHLADPFERQQDCWRTTAS